jgi:rubredoxin
VLGEQLRRAILSYYKYRATQVQQVIVTRQEELPLDHRHQCVSCLSMYDPAYGDLSQGVEIGTAFKNLPAEFCCELCDAPKSTFRALGN